MNVRLTHFNEAWAQKFQEEAQFLVALFGDEIIKCEHFGSTSVKGMMAKPVIDMMCLVKDIKKIDGYNEQMAKLGYDVAGEWGIPGRRLVRKGGENRTHHIHFYQYDHKDIHRHLVVRDYLRTHPDEVNRYSQFKEDLAERFENTTDYSPAKKEFVKALEERALQWSDKV